MRSFTFYGGIVFALLIGILNFSFIANASDSPGFPTSGYPINYSLAAHCTACESRYHPAPAVHADVQTNAVAPANKIDAIYVSNQRPNACHVAFITNAKTIWESDIIGDNTDLGMVREKAIEKYNKSKQVMFNCRVEANPIMCSYEPGGGLLLASYDERDAVADDSCRDRHKSAFIRFFDCHVPCFFGFHRRCDLPPTAPVRDLRNPCC